jgi:hypothetical protein
MLSRDRFFAVLAVMGSTFQLRRSWWLQWSRERDWWRVGWLRDPDQKISRSFPVKSLESGA